MIIFATGISGSKRLEYLEEVVKLARGEVEIKDIGSLMFEKSRHLGIDIPEGKILDLDPFALNYLRAAIFEEILKEKSRLGKRKDLIISTHTCFRWKKHLVPAFNFYYLNRLNPDLYITVIDNIHKVKARLEKRPHWRGRLSIKDLLIWRDEEVFITEMLAQYQNKPYYIIARDEGPELLYDIIYRVEKRRKKGETPALKAYLSYPITHVQEEFLVEKEEIKRRLKEAGVIVFDPISIKEVELLGYAEEAKIAGQEMIEVEVDGEKEFISVRELEEAREDIVNQVVARDYKLIEQSDVIVVYYPIPTLSPGVLSEINYGFTHNKDVFTIFPHENISPFFEYYTTRIFKDVDALLDYLNSQGYLA
ncbi:MAG: hypothetical protein DRJ38_06650 [Thermoprotei archaeon]|nr:MAG: hypothetical protein DRJ38_06650 [Thermoprotei archaeon]